MKITDCYIFIIFMNYVQRFIIFHLIFFTFRCLHIGFPVTQWKRILLPTQETSIPWVRKIPWRREWQPAPVFCLENPMDRGDWGATVHRVAKSQT